MKRHKAVIFDFDGTLADSFDYFARFLAGDTDLLFFNEEQMATLRGLSLQDTARRMGYSWWRMPFLYYSGRRWMGQHASKLKPYRGIPRTIRQLHKDGYRLYIVSSNSPDNIRKFLVKQRINRKFVRIYGNIGMGGKTRILRRAVWRYRLDRARTYYVGDEARDIKAARRAGINSIGVTWGYSNIRKIKQAEPDYIARRPRQLRRIIY